MANLIKTVNFTTRRSGLATIAYTLINSDGSTKQARTTTGIFETAVGTGIYAVEISFDDAWEGIILWDDGQATKRYAVDTQLRSSSAEEIADAVWDEDITTHTTADSTAQRLAAIFKYVRADGFGGTRIISRNVGDITDEDKKKIFKWFDVLLNQIRTYQQSNISIFDKTIKEINKFKTIIPSTKKFAEEIAPQFTESHKRTSKALTNISTKLQNQSQIELINRISHNIKLSFSDLKISLTETTKNLMIKESKWEEIKDLIKNENNTESILHIIRLHFKEINPLKMQIENISKEISICSDILLKEAPTKILEEMINE